MTRTHWPSSSYRTERFETGRDRFYWRHLVDTQRREEEARSLRVGAALVCDPAQAALLFSNVSYNAARRLASRDMLVAYALGLLPRGYWHRARR